MNARFESPPDLHVPGVEWASVAPGTVIIATREQAWAHSLVWGGPFAMPMAGPGSSSTTRQLLDGALRAGWGTGRATPEPPLTAERWAWRLCGFYQTTHATPPLMLEAADRFEAAGRQELADWARTKAREEQGHDTLALRDLSALGYDAQAAVDAVVPPGPAALVRAFEHWVRAEDPIGCVGYAYALERLALEFNEDYLRRVEACLPPGVRATRCLRVHSAAGSDVKHVAEAVAFIATLSAQERAAVARSCHETAVLCRESSSRGEPSEEAVHRLLEPFSTRRKSP